MNNLDFWIPEKTQISSLRKQILRWYKRNKRTYPWRITKDPFKVLVAEMMLRRTKADQVKPVFIKFISLYPNIDSLASASLKDLTTILSPLGLKWRIPAFKSVATELKVYYQGIVPLERDKLKSLTGVGEYVAGAVLSIAANKREWVIDSNVVRVFARYFGIKTSKEGRRDKHVIEVAKHYVWCRKPKEANLALLDFSSLVCKPNNPICLECPISSSCQNVVKPFK